MVRLLFDEQGNCTGDLFIKIDGRPSRTWTVDTGWLDTFFDEDHGLSSKEKTVPTTDDDLIMSRKEDVGLLIKLWKQLLLSDEPVCYLAGELSDQCGWALRVTKRKKLYHITPVSTIDITDGVSKTRFLQVQHRIVWRQYDSTHEEWNLNPAAMVTGLDWSLAKLNQPIIPLRYD